MKLQGEIHEFTIGQSNVYVWNYRPTQLEDHSHHLHTNEKERLNKFKHLTRQHEFIASRLLCRKLFGSEPIHYNNIGAPYIMNGGILSLSHCKDHVAIAVNNEHQIGLDIETPRFKAIELSKKFMSTDEEIEFDIDDHVEVTKVWSAKEAMYKLAGRKKIIFKTELNLKKNTADNWHGRIINPDKDILVNLNIFEHEGLIISINQDEPIEKY